MNDILYNKLNKKLDNLRRTKLQKSKQGHSYTTTNISFHARIKNMSNIHFNKEERQIFQLGLNYAFEKPTKHYLQDLIIDTEHAIRQLNEDEQNIYRYLACNKIKQIQEISTNTLHKRHNYIVKQIRKKLEQNNLTINKADKGNTIVIIDKNILTQKTEDFLKENKFNPLHKDPTNKFKKQTQQTLQKCNRIIDKQQIKYLLEIKPRPPILNAQLKIHKDDIPIRPIVNNIQTPAYKTAKFFNKWLNDRLSLPNTYVTYNSTKLANDLIQLNITKTTKMATFDIKDLYVNIPITETINIMKTRLTKNNIDNETATQATILLDTILRQNYLQFNDKFFQPHKGVAMGSPISGLVAEIFLQHYEEKLLKSILDTKKIIFYNRYVDDVIIFHDEHLTNTNEILNYINNIHPQLHFKAKDEEDITINFLDLLITKERYKLSINIYRKPTATDTTIHYKSLQNKYIPCYYIYNQ